MTSAEPPLEQPQRASAWPWARGWLPLLLGVTLLGGSSGIWETPVHCDEQEHLHVAWMWNQGQQPFIDFFEHHPPLYWLLLRPLVAAGSPADLLQLWLMGRTVSLLLLLGCAGASAWLWRRLLPSRAAALAGGLTGVTLVCCSSALHVRPDLLMLLLLLGGTGLALDATGLSLASPPRRRAWRAVGAGILLALAGLVLTKAAFWVLALGLTLGVLALRQRQTDQGAAGKAWLLIAASLAGTAVLHFIWIAQTNDLLRYWMCVVAANGKLAGSTLLNLDAFAYGTRNFPGWVLLSPPLLIPGILLGFTPSSGMRPAGAAVVVALLAGNVLLYLLGNGPHEQYLLPLLPLLAGPLALSLLTLWAALASRLRRLAVAGVLLTLAGWVLLQWPPGARQGNLRASLAVPQLVQNLAQPGDTYINLTPSAPVYLPHAAPPYFHLLSCFNEPAQFDLMHELVLQERPRFLFGVGAPLWVRGVGMINVSASPQIQALYVDLGDYIMERRDLYEARQHPAAAP